MGVILTDAAPRPPATLVVPNWLHEEGLKLAWHRCSTLGTYTDAIVLTDSWRDDLGVCQRRGGHIGEPIQVRLPARFQIPRKPEEPK